jgi:NAD(P)-dependent dehydrogenase (short-subunit alcohol dehydrogenase family)
VVIADIDSTGGMTLVAELGETTRFVATDVSRDADIDTCVQATVKAFGRIDCLVNVAAVYADNGPASPREDWEKAFAVNVFGAAMFLRACRPHMAAAARWSTSAPPAPAWPRPGGGPTRPPRPRCCSSPAARRSIWPPTASA